MQNLLSNLKNKIKVRQYKLNKEVILGLMPAPGGELRLLDIGCNNGLYTGTVCKRLGIKTENCYGVDYNPDVVPPFNFTEVDLEDGILPFEPGFFDLVMMDQVLEHLKNIGKVIEEINRVLKKRGTLIISVPNLASLPSRLLLLSGRMPLGIQGIEHHVRGFTAGSIKGFLEGKCFEVAEIRGGAFYPGPVALSRLLQRLFPTLAHFICLRAEKTGDIAPHLLSREKHFHADQSL